MMYVVDDHIKIWLNKKNVARRNTKAISWAKYTITFQQELKGKGEANEQISLGRTDK